MKKSLFLSLTLAYGLLSVAVANAATSEQIVDRAADCAAISFIETAAFPERNAQSEIITQRSMLTSRILAVALSMREPDKVITNGDVSQTKGARARTLNMIWSQDPEEVHATQRLCWEWFVGIFEHVQAVRTHPGIKTEKQAIESALSLPIASLRKPFDAQRYAALDQILTTAIKNWRAQGSITPDQTRDVIDRDPVNRD